jgi:hypothetical protein
VVPGDVFLADTSPEEVASEEVLPEDATSGNAVSADVVSVTEVCEELTSEAIVAWLDAAAPEDIFSMNVATTDRVSDIVVSDLVYPGDVDWVDIDSDDVGPVDAVSVDDSLPTFVDSVSRVEDVASVVIPEVPVAVE